MRDIIFAGGGDDTIVGAEGADQLFGEGGNDTFFVTNNDQQTRDRLDGGAGSDLMLVAISGGITGAQVQSFERLGFTDTVTPKTFDILAAQVGDGLASGLAIDGNNLATDTLRVLMRADTSVSLAGFKFTEWSAAAGDRIVVLGDASAETIIGSKEADTIIGAGGNDRLDGSGGGDRLQGGAGNDIYSVDTPGEAAKAADQGSDLVRSSVGYVLGANLERLQLLGTGDLLGTGNGLGNGIVGNSGANRISGLGGNDILTGGAGGDRSVFNTVLNAATNVDRIADFVAADDTILLDRSIFSAVEAGTLAAGAFRLGTSAADASDRIVYDQPTGRIFYDADGAGGAAQILFARVGGGTVVGRADFFASGSSSAAAAAPGSGWPEFGSSQGYDAGAGLHGLFRHEALTPSHAGFLV